MDFVKNSPTFDMNQIKPGEALAVVIKDRRGYIEQQYNAIITEATPLQFTVMYWDDSRHESKRHVIHIDPVVKKLTEIRLLK